MTNKKEKNVFRERFFLNPVRNHHLFILILVFCLIGPMHASAELNDSEKTRIIQDFDTYAEDLFIKYKLPGMAIAITDRDKILYAKGFGVTSLESKKPVNNTIIDPGYLTGTYQNDYYGVMKISVDSGAFVAELGPRPLRMNLTPINTTAYLFALTPQIKGLPNPDGMFSCTSGPDGRAAEITVLGLTMPEEPPYTFTRT